MRRRTIAVLVLVLLLAACGLGLWITPTEQGPAKPQSSTASITPEQTPYRAAEEVGPDAPLADWREVHCLLPVEPLREGWIEVLVEPPGAEPVWSSGRISATHVSFMAPEAEGAGLVVLPGFERAGLIWFAVGDGETECTFPMDPRPAATGSVRLRAPDTLGRGVSYEVCGTKVTGPGDPDGWVEVDAVPGPCSVRVCVFSEYRTYPCADVGEIDVVASAVAAFDMRLPPLPADFAFDLIEREDGLLLRYHADGVTTERLILAAEGLPASELSPEDLEDLALDGQVVDVEIASADGSVRTGTFSLPQPYP